MSSISGMQLYYQIYPKELDSLSALSTQESPPLLILPGLFGANINWRSVAQKLSIKRPVLVFDLRNHGQSAHRDSHTYQDMVDDLYTFLNTHSIKKVDLLGHSMGGKVAMLFAHQHPLLLQHLLVLDIAPVRYDHSHAPLIQELLKFDLDTLVSRADADRKLAQKISDNATRLFLLQSLAGGPGNYYWKLNLPVLLEFMPQIADFPNLQSSCSVESKFIYGLESDYVTQAHQVKIRDLFGNAEFAGIEGAGHWLHAEKPQAVIEQIEVFLTNE